MKIKQEPKTAPAWSYGLRNLTEIPNLINGTWTTPGTIIYGITKVEKLHPNGKSHILIGSKSAEAWADPIYTDFVFYLGMAYCNLNSMHTVFGWRDSQWVETFYHKVPIQHMLLYPTKVFRFSTQENGRA